MTRRRRRRPPLGTASELLDYTIARIEAVDQRINAVVVRDFDRWPAASTKPCSSRDTEVDIQCRRAPDYRGFPKFKDFVPTEDALAASRLKQAGAIIIGKTNIPIGLREFQSYKTSRCKRGPCQVHGIEQELRFKRLAKMCGLTKSVLLILEYKETGWDVSALKRGVHALGLIDRHDRIVLTVKKYHWGGEHVGEIDRRTVVVKCAVGHKWLNEPVGVV
jgi:hypothetical protein